MLFLFNNQSLSKFNKYILDFVKNRVGIYLFISSNHDLGTTSVVSHGLNALIVVVFGYD